MLLLLQPGFKLYLCHWRVQECGRPNGGHQWSLRPIIYQLYVLQYYLFVVTVWMTVDPPNFICLCVMEISIGMTSLWCHIPVSFILLYLISVHLSQLPEVLSTSKNPSSRYHGVINGLGLISWLKRQRSCRHCINQLSYLNSISIMLFKQIWTKLYASITSILYLISTDIA